MTESAVEYATPVAKIAAARARYTVHDLKTVQPYFAATNCGAKTFEIRVADRDFQPGDVLILREWTGERYTGKECVRAIDYVLRDYDHEGVNHGYCVMSLRPLKVEDLRT